MEEKCLPNRPEVIFHTFGVKDLSTVKPCIHKQRTVLRTFQHKLQDLHLSSSEMAQVTQRGCGVTIPGDDQQLSGHGPGQPSPGVPV